MKEKPLMVTEITYCKYDKGKNQSINKIINKI